MDYLRQGGIVTPDDLNFEIVLIGAGGIGSPTALALGKMGCKKLTIYEPDLIEEHNLPNQIYPLGSVGRPKAAVLAEVLTQFTECLPNVIQQEITGKERLAGVVISAVDSMASRASIWEAVRFNSAVPLYIDGRMGGEIGIIYSVNPNDPEDVRFYETSLHSDDEAIQIPCTERAIIYNTFMIASLIASQVKKYAVGETLRREIIFEIKNLVLLTDNERTSAK